VYLAYHIDFPRQERVVLHDPLSQPCQADLLPSQVSASGGTMGNCPNCHFVVQTLEGGRFEWSRRWVCPERGSFGRESSSIPLIELIPSDGLSWLIPRLAVGIMLFVGGAIMTPEGIIFGPPVANTFIPVGVGLLALSFLVIFLRGGVIVDKNMGMVTHWVGRSAQWRISRREQPLPAPVMGVEIIKKKACIQAGGPATDGVYKLRGRI
jgi:hypothetical protein